MVKEQELKTVRFVNLGKQDHAREDGILNQGRTY